MNIEIGKQYVLRNGDVIDIKKSLEMYGRCVFITSQDRVCDKDGNDVFVLFASSRMVIEPENKEYDIIEEYEPQNFQSQKEIWDWLAGGGKVYNKFSHVVCFINGFLNWDYDFKAPSEWKKYIEPQKKHEWFETLDGTIDNAWVCWVSDDQKKWMVETIGYCNPNAVHPFRQLGDAEGYQYANPIMLLSKFKQLYPAT